MHSLLRSLWHEPPPADPPRRVWRDWALVGVIVPVAFVEATLRRDLPEPLLSLAVALALLPTLLWRRTRPAWTVAAVAAGTVVSLLAGDAYVDLYVQAYLLILPYSLFRWGSGAQALTGLAVLLGSLVSTFFLHGMAVTDLIGGGVVLSATVALGAALRYRAGVRARELDRAKLLERERLARDLHDTVAHHVSAIVIRAQAGLAVAATRPDAAQDALRVIEAEATRALAEMRAIVRVLRDGEPADLSPAPGIGDLPNLAGHPGPPVDVSLTGDVGGLAPAVGAAIYHLARESVTNARRHARHATRIDVRVVADAERVRLTVSDDGDAGPAAPAGYGLTGMMERARLLGGACHAGPGGGRGWTVSAVLPRDGVAA